MRSSVLQLQAMAEDNSVSIEKLLIRARVISFKLGLTDETEWLQNEINGYPKSPELPAYRLLKHSKIMALDPSLGWIPFDYFNVGEKSKDFYDALTTVYVTNPISNIVECSNMEGPVYANMPLDLSAFLRALEKINFPLCWQLDVSHMMIIINKVRARVLDWSLELEKNGILGEGISFLEEGEDNNRQYHVTNNHFNNHSITISGKLIAHNSVFATGNLASVSQENKDDVFNKLECQLKEYGIDDADIEELKQAVKICSNPDTKKDVEKGFGAWIGKMTGKGFTGSIKIAGAAAPTLLTNVLCHYFGIPV